MNDDLNEKEVHLSEEIFGYEESNEVDESDEGEEDTIEQDDMLTCMRDGLKLKNKR